MLHAQQNHNTNYPNHANVRQVRPNVRESVGKRFDQILKFLNSRAGIDGFPFKLFFF